MKIAEALRAASMISAITDCALAETPFAELQFSSLMVIVLLAICNGFLQR